MDYSALKQKKKTIFLGSLVNIYRRCLNRGTQTHTPYAIYKYRIENTFKLSNYYFLPTLIIGFRSVCTSGLFVSSSLRTLAIYINSTVSGRIFVRWWMAVQKKSSDRYIFFNSCPPDALARTYAFMEPFCLDNSQLGHLILIEFFCTAA